MPKLSTAALDQAVLATIAYSDIFDYPLKKEEILRFLIVRKATIGGVEKSLYGLIKQKKIENKGSLYFLKDRSKITLTRKQRAKHSQKKLKRALFFAQILKMARPIKLVGISGALAMENSHQKDDIDLFIATSHGTLWTTRFFANLLLTPYKRSPASKKTNDKACLNMFVEEPALEVGPPNIYLAHEICQMKVLWSRGATYRKFLDSNRWVKKFLPNWQPDAVNGKSFVPSREGKIERNTKIHSPFTIRHSPLEPLEALAKWGQLWYMRKKITTEKIGNHQLSFHPRNSEGRIIEEFERRLKKLKIKPPIIYLKSFLTRRFSL